MVAEGGDSEGASPDVDASSNPADADAAMPPDACTGASCTPPSCAASLMCGAAGDSCCTSLLVTGDSFLRHNETAYPATVSSFRLDKYETTVGRFRAFVADVLADLEVAQLADDGGADDEAHEERGQAGEGGAEGEETKNAERREIVEELFVEEPVEQSSCLRC